MLMAVQPETGILPLLAVVAAKLVGAAAFVGKALALGAAVELVSSAFGDEEEAIAQALEPLLPATRASWLGQMDHWETAARKRFSGPALQAALAAVSRGRQVIGPASSTWADVHGATVGLDRLFDELNAKPEAMGGGGEKGGAHWWSDGSSAEAATPASAKARAPSGAPVFVAAAPGVASGGTTSWGLVLGLGALVIGGGLWLFSRRKR